MLVLMLVCQVPVVGCRVPVLVIYNLYLYSCQLPEFIVESYIVLILVLSI